METSVFKVSINITDTTEHQMVLLLFSPQSLDLLANALGNKPAENEDAVVDLIHQALDPARLSDTIRDSNSVLPRCSLLFNVLRVVPTLESIASRTKPFEIEVPFERTCPVTESGSWMAICKGPQLI